MIPPPPPPKDAETDQVQVDSAPNITAPFVEIEGMQGIAEALVGLDPEATARVLGWAVAFHLGGLIELPRAARKRENVES